MTIQPLYQWCIQNGVSVKYLETDDTTLVFTLYMTIHNRKYGHNHIVKTDEISVAALSQWLTDAREELLELFGKEWDAGEFSKKVYMPTYEVRD